MINRVLYWLHRPENGWDPVPLEYAEKYALRCYEEDIDDVCANLLDFTGDLRGKNVLDLGAGPGQFSAFFAKNGAYTTWFDISKNYLTIFRKYFPELDVTEKVSYLDDVDGQYDFIFNRVCWYYCINDKKFSKAIYKALKPGAKAYLIIPNEGYLASLPQKGIKRLVRYLQFYLNNWFGIKIGHPMNTTRRISDLFNALPWRELTISVDGRETIVKCQK